MFLLKNVMMEILVITKDAEVTAKGSYKDGIVILQVQPIAII